MSAVLSRSGVKTFDDIKYIIPRRREAVGEVAFCASEISEKLKVSMAERNHAVYRQFDDDAAEIFDF